MYYVELTYEDTNIPFKSLLKAVKFAVESENTSALIHNGYRNFDYYRKGDTIETLLARCEAYENAQ